VRLHLAIASNSKLTMVSALACVTIVARACLSLDYCCAFKPVLALRFNFSLKSAATVIAIAIAIVV